MRLNRPVLVVVVAAVASAVVVVLSNASPAVGLGVLGLALLPLYGRIVTRWESGLYGLVLFMPFTGIPAILLYPSDLAALAKDVLFVIPLYLGFLASVFYKGGRFPRMPGVPVVFMASVAVLAVAQSLNPSIPHPLVPLIGLKVWLSYFPLLLISYEFFRSQERFLRLLRLMVAVAFVPALIGIAEAVAVRVFGYETTMIAIYGPAANDVTQGFAQFEVGAGTIYRIPSTFTFLTQFYGYLLAMLAPTYGAMRADPSQFWRRIAALSFVAVVTASFLCGSRGVFVFVPMTIALSIAFDRGTRGVIQLARYSLIALFIGSAVLMIMRIAPTALFDHVAELFTDYAQIAAYDGLAQALAEAPWGEGTGTNTGPARYAFSEAEAASARALIENYYAKAAYEFGLLGLIAVGGMFVSLAIAGYRAHARLSRSALRPYSGALATFLVVTVLHNFKGWQVDLDPINVYYWVFAGMLLRLPTLDRRPATSAGRGRAREGARTSGTPQPAQSMRGRAALAIALLLLLAPEVGSESTPPSMVAITKFGAVADSTTDNTAAVQQAIDSIQHVGGTVLIPPGSFRVTTLTLKPGITLQGSGWSRDDPKKGSVLVGTSGFDVITLPTRSGFAHNFAIADMTITGGRNQLMFPADPQNAHARDTGYAYVRVHNVRFAQAQEAAIRVRRHLEQFYLSQSMLEGSRWGVFVEPSTQFFDKCTFRESVVSGMRDNAFRVHVPYSTTVTWDNVVIYHSGEHGIHVDAGARQWLFINLNTEGNGTTGKQNRTRGTINEGASSLSVADADGYEVGDRVTVEGAGADGTDLQERVVRKDESTLILAAPALRSVTNAAVTNAIYDDVLITDSIARAQQVTFLGGALGGESLYGRLRYGINASGAMSVLLFGTDVYNSTNSSDDIAVYDPHARVTKFGARAKLRRGSPEGSDAM